MPQVLAAVRRDLRTRYREPTTRHQRVVGEEALDDDPRAEGPRRRAGDRDQRSADAGHAGHRRAGAIARGLSARAPRAADRVLGHRRRDQGDQRRAPRSLPVEAVGIRRRSACSRSIDDLLDAWQAEYLPEAKGLRLVGHQWSPRSHADQGLPRRQSDPVSLARRGARPGHAQPARRGRDRRRASCRRCSSRTASVAAQSRAAPGGRASRPIALGRARRCTTW